MTPPLCIAPSCLKPVTRNYNKKPDRRGVRTVDGVRWRWYCCSECAAREMGRENWRKPGFQIAAKAHREQRTARELAKLVALCKGLMDDQHRVDAREFVKVLMQEKAKEYLRGYSAGVMRARRAA